MNGTFEPSGRPAEAALAGRLAALRARIEAACRAADRQTDSVGLLAVSKTFDAGQVLEAAALGQSAFGENYVQEALDKIASCRTRHPESALTWHFIGPIQSNKTRQIAEAFDWVHSVDREKIAVRLGQQRPEAMAPLQCCVQVNVSGEASKSGCAPEAALDLARTVAAQPRLRLRGLMVIPEPTDDVALQRSRFASARLLLAQLREKLGREAPQVAAGLDTLSMGMSADLESAIAEGATIVRIGSALFGARPAAAAGPSPDGATAGAPTVRPPVVRPSP
ncbi:MAG: YggS family pyridoxal phosphate-dependent enzyme [Burkholderiaceae bacterium]